MRLSNPWSAEEIAADMAKGGTNGVAAVVDAGVSMATLGHGPQIGPVFKEERYLRAYNVARPIAAVGFSIGVGGGLGKLAGMAKSPLVRGAAKVGGEFAAGALGAKGMDNDASVETMVKDGVVSVATLGAARGAGKVAKAGKSAPATGRGPRPKHLHAPLPRRPRRPSLAAVTISPGRSVAPTASSLPRSSSWPTAAPSGSPTSRSARWCWPRIPRPANAGHDA